MCVDGGLMIDACAAWKHSRTKQTSSVTLGNGAIPDANGSQTTIPEIPLRVRGCQSVLDLESADKVGIYEETT
jgi:hypothetical protein